MISLHGTQVNDVAPALISTPDFVEKGAALGLRPGDSRRLLDAISVGKRSPDSSAWYLYYVVYQTLKRPPVILSASG